MIDLSQVVKIKVDPIDVMEQSKAYKRMMFWWKIATIIFVTVFLVGISMVAFADTGYKVVSTNIYIVTAYNVGDPNQCDDTPCIDASNTNICEALDRGEKRCAANFVKKGTLLDIEGYGICKVTDRTNRRYKYRVDIAMKKDEKTKALKWGRKKLVVKILEK